MRAVFGLLVAWWALTASISAQDNRPRYGWPLNIDNGYSSSFQEFRADHFHAGIDLRTFRQTGFPVLAVADGVITRIRVVKNGSGKGIYLRHNDGNTSIYFHLDRFNDPIERVVARQRLRQRQKYFGDYFFPNPVPVRRGDLIGYSGETGSGLPHLHLEIRDQDQRILNPFFLLEFPGRDLQPPMLRGMLVRSRGDSLVNGDSGERYIPFTFQEGRFVPRQPLFLQGTADFVLDAFDLADTGKVVAPYSISASIDNQTYFRLDMDGFNRDDNNQLGFVYDLFHSGMGSFFYNLSYQTGFEFDKLKVRLAGLIQSLPAGGHELRILVKDHFLNQSMAVIPLVIFNRPLLEIAKIQTRDNRLRVTMAKTLLYPETELGFRLLGPAGEILFSGVLATAAVQASSMVSPEFPAGLAPFFIEFFQVRDNIVIFRKRVALAGDLGPALGDVDFQTFINGEGVSIKLNNFLLPAADIRLEVEQPNGPQTVPALEKADGIFFCFRPAATVSPLRLKFIRLSRGMPVEEIQKTLHLIRLTAGQPQSFVHGEFAVQFASRSVYEDKVLQVRPATIQTEFPVESTAIDMSPADFPFLDEVWVEFRPAAAAEIEPRQLGIFRLHPGTGSWRYLKTVAADAGRSFRTRVLAAGQFALLRDIFPPEIGFVSLNGKQTNQIERLIIPITDRGMGVDEMTLKVILNEAVLDAEYDPDRSQVSIDQPRPLRRGANHLKVEIRDLAGNPSGRIFDFILR